MISWIERISPRLNIVWRGRWRAGQIEPARYLYDHELVIVTQGTCEVRFEERAVTLSAGDYLIIPPDTCHATTVGGGGVTRHCFHFDWEAPVEAVPHQYCSFFPARPEPAAIVRAPSYVPDSIGSGRCPADGSVRPLMETLRLRWQTGEALARQTCRGVFLELLLRLIWPATETTRPAERAMQLAQQVKDLLDHPDTQQENIQTLLASLGFSYAHLCRLFRRAFGLTPVEYRTALRLEHAKTLLRDGDMTVGEAALAAGFRDPGYFARCFRRQNGITPSAFR